jgi:tetratricopeptide (TPR) repeat protein
MRAILTIVMLLVIPLATPGAGTLAAQLDLGLRQQKAGDLKRAAALYREILDKNPRYPAARHLPGICQLQLGNLADGIANLETVRKEYPQNRQAIYTLVSTYVAISMLDEAQEILQTNLRLDKSAEASCVDLT